MVVVGSRARPRSVVESTVPIDAIPSEDIVSQGSTDVSDQLRTLVPSYNVNPQPVGDAARLIRPANLRGLAPDHTLVLVNGKRRHRGAVITWIGNGVSDGAQGPDISTIPAIALRQIEVLRDGAAAQYGSDAIAGVLNFQLKDDRSGGSLELHTGGYGAGDGGTYTVSGNAGVAPRPVRLRQPQRRVRQCRPDQSQRAAGRCRAPDRGRQRRGGRSGADLGIAQNRRQRQAVGQLRPSVRLRRAGLRTRQLRQPAGSQRILLPEPHQPGPRCSAPTGDRAC